MMCSFNMCPLCHDVSHWLSWFVITFWNYCLLQPSRRCIVVYTSQLSEAQLTKTVITPFDGNSHSLHQYFHLLISNSIHRSRFHFGLVPFWSLLRDQINYVLVSLASYRAPQNSVIVSARTSGFFFHRSELINVIPPFQVSN